MAKNSYINTNMIENIKSFGELAGNRLRESIEDLDAFNLLLIRLKDIDELEIAFASEPTMLIHDQQLFAFTVLFEDYELRFHCSLITDEIESALSYDPYFIDISYLADVLVSDLEKDDVIETLDSISGFYVDPIRPFSWLVDKSYYPSDTTLEQAAQTFLTVLKNYFYLQLDHKPKLTLVVNNP